VPELAEWRGRNLVIKWGGGGRRNENSIILRALTADDSNFNVNAKKPDKPRGDFGTPLSVILAVYIRI
jgi:hypothetical protein